MKSALLLTSLKESQVGALRAALEGLGLRVECAQLDPEGVSPCLGCGHCGLQTPGVCVHSKGSRDGFDALLRRIPHHDMLVLSGAIVLGTWEADLKRGIDRFMPLIRGKYTRRQGETHHQMRYSQPSRLLCLGVQPEPCDQDAQRLARLAARHAVNWAMQAHASLMLPASALQDQAGPLSELLETALAQLEQPKAPPPWPQLKLAEPIPPPQRLVLLAASTRRRSTSSAMVEYVDGALQAAPAARLRLSLRDLQDDQAKGESLLQALREGASLFLAFPIYLDGPPAQLLAWMHEASTQLQGSCSGALSIAVHSGYPESVQRMHATEVCHAFATQTGLRWHGALSFGGTPLIDGRRLEACGGAAKHLRRALSLAAEDLAAGQPLGEATQAAARKHRLPFPKALLPLLMNLMLWRKARKLGVDLNAQPFLDRGQ
ncbi:MAG: hypothetical protein RBU37_10430 [Myxococcota bacterium]|jgi:multimeric flavodoxin WrbA|nr:hypothetical protein [Myxococcota bacterium]